MSADVEMTCEQLEALLDDWFCGQLENTVLVIVERHLGCCPDCGKQFDLYRATVAVCRQLPPNPPEPLPDEFARRLRKMILSDDE